MEEYRKEFKKYNLIVGQGLAECGDFDSRKKMQNLKQTYKEFIKRKAVFIFNENDTMSVEEIKFGDNDILSAYLFCELKFDVLINKITYNGLLRNGKIIEVADSYDKTDYDNIKDEIKESRGGLEGKLKSMKIVNQSNGIGIISNYRFSILDILKGNKQRTIFLPNLLKNRE